MERARRLLPGLWAGLLLCVALVATPAAFALLPRADAGRIAARVLAQEAAASLAFGAALLVLERVRVRRGARQFNADFALPLGAIFCTVAGYYAVQPMMEAARAGQGALTFGQLHAVSAAFYVVKAVLVLVLAWRAAGSVRTLPTS